MLWRDGIERDAGRKALARPLSLVPLTAENPLPRRRLRGALAYKFGHFVLAGALSGVDVVGTIGFHHQVDMRVDRSGQHRLAAQIDHLRVPVTRAAHLVLAADRQNAPAAGVDGD